MSSEQTSAFPAQDDDVFRRPQFRSAYPKEPKVSVRRLDSAHSSQYTSSREKQRTFSDEVPALPRQEIYNHEDRKFDKPSRWSGIRNTCIEGFSEFFGTFIFITFSLGSVAQVTLSNEQKGEYESIAWGFGLGIMIGAYVAGRSGGHLNPAVTFAQCILRKFPWRKLPIYAFAQLLGGFCAAGVVFGNYKSAIALYEGGVLTVPGTNSTHPTAGIFATYPQSFMTVTGEFFSEFLASALLLFCIFALLDESNAGSAGKFFPMGLMFVMFGIASCFGWETGFAMNAARDFAPRLMTWALGYGTEVWTVSGGYAWVPVIAPFLGCTFGGWLYDTFLNTGKDESRAAHPTSPV